jgi:hypothetical protein
MLNDVVFMLIGFGVFVTIMLAVDNFIIKSFKKTEREI